MYFLFGLMDKRNLIHFLKNLIEIFLPESRSVLINVLYRRPDKCDFVNCLERTLGDTDVIETKEYYLLGDVNIKLQTRDKDLFRNKCTNAINKEIPHLLGHI